jgi:hypothetical protein
MIIEQAFFNLPEVLVGTGYQKQDYEAGIVSAMSLAILQALNGRNLDNPISAIRVEKRYPFDNTKNRKKYLRYDLDLDIGNLGILNSRMKKYGWRRHSNLECKFFRTAGNKKPANTTTNSILCLLDVIRLCTLQTSKDSTRYFLHVYDRNPNEYRVADLTDMDNLFRAGRRIIEIDCSALATRQTSNKKSVETV